MKKPVRAILEGIIVGIISAVLAMILFFIPVLNVLVLLFPVPIIVIGVRQGVFAGILSLAVSSVLMGLFIHPLFGVTLFSLNLFLALALIYAYKKGYTMNESMILSAGGTLLSILVSLQVFTWIAGESFFDFLWNSIRAFIGSHDLNFNRLMEIYQSLGVIDGIHSPDSFAEILIGQMKDMAPLLPSLLLISSLLIGGLSFLVSGSALRRMGSPVPRISPFRRWSLPRGTGRGFLGLMVIAAIGNWIKLPNFEVVLYTVSSVFTFLFTVQGLSVASFYLGQKRIPGVIAVLILIVAFVLFSVGLTFLGIIEQMLGIRRAYGSNR